MDNLTDTDTSTLSLSPAGLAGSDSFRELERFAEIGRLSAMLLHEIAGPLSAALLWLEQCEGQSPYVRHVRRSIRLIQDYVEAARQQIRRESRCREFPIRPELRQVAGMLMPVAARQGVSLELAPGGAHRLYGDPVKFQHIVANLVRNAIDSYHECPAGGYRPVRLRFRRVRRYLLMEVSDQGCGIDGGQFDKLFRPFYSTKAGRGLGIGLFSVKSSVEEDFRGSVHVASAPGSGTRFTVRFRLGRPDGRCVR